jgi:hypothetical protein
MLYLVLINLKSKGKTIPLKRNLVLIRLARRSRISGLGQERQLKMQNQREISLTL